MTTQYDPLHTPDWQTGPPPCLAAAWYWAEHLGPVFPCAAQTKRPIIKGGFLSASQDRTTIQGWFNKTWNANVALAVPENLVIVDLDRPEAADGLRAEGLILPPTFTVRTAHGEHHYYRVDRPVARQVHWRPRVDLCGGMKEHAGFVLLPPSRHPSGVIYREIVPLEEQAIADAPEWVHGPRAGESAEAAEARRSSAPSASTYDPVAGSRHGFLMRAARQNAREGLDAEQILMELADLCEERGWADKPASELRSLAQWAADAERDGREP